MNIRINFTNGDSAVWENFLKLQSIEGDYGYAIWLVVTQYDYSEYAKDAVKSFEVFS